MRKHLSRILWACILVAFLDWVYPTPYIYDHIGLNPVRTNRITGSMEFLTLQGWQPQLPIMIFDPNASAPEKPQPRGDGAPPAAFHDKLASR